jgi:predicted ATPase
MGAGLLQSYFLALLAETYEEIGRTEEGLAVLAEALATAAKTGEHFWEAELYRLKGELTLQSQTSLTQVSSKSKASQNKSKVNIPQSAFRNPKSEEAEACFHKAIEVARRQQARSLELRATISFARLWQRQGKKDEAQQMLAEIYGWFGEGFETEDLHEAKALLGQLT